MPVLNVERCKEALQRLHRMVTAALRLGSATPQLLPHQHLRQRCLEGGALQGGNSAPVLHAERCREAPQCLH